ncbi:MULTISPECIES: hypothetical protein [unclassified Streptomyces]|uniref:hypothetical protein n=1 Tax=unclassified Streptomyces TaxID=2593676 RepID=UPI001BE4EA6D|nr:MULTISPECIES: hypothetical protein [unclassified Streptomyces]MBT2405476.1 hypothetical protein [Streptomyces sp. ISL-21]MBT2454394.1 hypothetical protein [Streptomyces sp. ISL-86]
MTCTSAGSRTLSTASAQVPARSLGRGLVIENLELLPDPTTVLFTVCAVTQVAGPVDPSAGRLAA